MDMLPVILIGLVLLLGLVAMGLSYKSWPIYTMLLLFFNLVAAGGFVYLGARTLKTYDVWRKELASWQKTYETKEKEVEEIINGGKQDVLLVNEKDQEAALVTLDVLPLDELRTRLTNAQTYRGKIWGLLDADTRRDAQKGPPILATLTAAGNTVTADLTWNLPLSPEAMGLKPGMVVFLFGDTLTEPQAAGYLGHFKIEAVQPKKLTLTRIEQLLQDEGLPGPNRPVLIYETFPNDDYRAFAGMTLPQLKQVLKDVPDETLQEFVKHGKPVTAAEEQALLNQAAIDDQAKNELATLNKGRVWHRVRVKELLPLSEISGKVARPAAAPMPMPGEEENPMPMAEEETLPSSFLAGAKILLDPDTAKQLVAAGKVAYDGDDYRIYMRPLRDYPNEYKNIRDNTVVLRAATAEVERLIKINAQTIASTDETTEKHKARTALVNEDLGNVKKEAAALAAYETQIRQRVTAVRAEEAAMLKNISQAAATITQLQLEALRKVNSLISAQDQAAAAP